MFYLVAEYIHQLYTENDYYHWILQQDPMLQEINALNKN